MEAWVLSLLRVPPEPTAPDGSPGSVRIFRAGKNYYRWRLVMWAWQQLLLILVAAMLLLGFFESVMRTVPAPVRSILSFLELAGVALVLAGAPFTFFLQRLNYRLRWYIVTDRSLRIRSGIWSVEELTMTFANIQDLGVTAGPLQGWLGLADVEVRSAGGGTPGPHGEKSPKHAARFEGVDNAEALRDLIVERLRQYRDAGLGDGDHHAPPEAAPVDAAQRVLAEARALRAALTEARPASPAG
ncbi:MAG: PH domain-containing protein [Bryobacteraceae bacterium]|nr:PH domain-containing protein [Bryobacteraceae bacterium]